MSWYEFVTADAAATTHIAYLHEDGSVYLPEAGVTEDDFRLASATDRFWRLARGSARAAYYERSLCDATSDWPLNPEQEWCSKLLGHTDDHESASYMWTNR